MTSTASTEAELRNQIARLTATINYHKTGQSSSLPASHPPHRGRGHAYVNPNYQPSQNKFPRPAYPVYRPSASTAPPPSQPKEVVLGGVAFKSSGRSLVRKGLPPAPSKPSAFTLPNSRKPGHLVPLAKNKPIPHRRLPIKRKPNMTLNNSNRPYQSVASMPAPSVWLTTYRRSRRTSKRTMKYLNKPCPRFTTTGSCNRGLTCMYQHDPAKIAICWNFLQGTCNNTASSCNLSHDPTPERTPLCVHFLNKGRCTRDNCPFPHVNVGARQGICRDFAVLGYCDKGLDCDKQHVRECPDFAEKGACTTKGCKLPHVIRANRNRKVPTAGPADASVSIVSSGTTDSDPSLPHLTAADAQLGDEFISLTFNESESSEDDEGSDEEASESESEAEQEPDDVDMNMQEV